MFSCLFLFRSVRSSPAPVAHRHLVLQPRPRPAALHPSSVLSSRSASSWTDSIAEDLRPRLNGSKPSLPSPEPLRTRYRWSSSAPPSSSSPPSKSPSTSSPPSTQSTYSHPKHRDLVPGFDVPPSSLQQSQLARLVDRHEALKARKKEKHAYKGKKVFKGGPSSVVELQETQAVEERVRVERGEGRERLSKWDQRILEQTQEKAKLAVDEAQAVKERAVRERESRKRMLGSRTEAEEEEERNRTIHISNVPKHMSVSALGELVLSTYPLLKTSPAAPTQPAPGAAEAPSTPPSSSIATGPLPEKDPIASDEEPSTLENSTPVKDLAPSSPTSTLGLPSLEPSAFIYSYPIGSSFDPSPSPSSDVDSPSISSSPPTATLQVFLPRPLQKVSGWNEHGPLPDWKIRQQEALKPARQEGQLRVSNMGFALMRFADREVRDKVLKQAKNKTVSTRYPKADAKSKGLQFLEPSHSFTSGRTYKDWAVFDKPTSTTEPDSEDVPQELDELAFAAKPEDFEEGKFVKSRVKSWAPRPVDQATTKKWRAPVMLPRSPPKERTSWERDGPRKRYGGVQGISSGPSRSRSVVSSRRGPSRSA